MYQIVGHIDDLETGLRGDAEAFGFSPKPLAEMLQSVAVDYLKLLREQSESRTRGAVINDLKYVLEGDEITTGRRVGALNEDVVAAMTGKYPNSRIKLGSFDGDGEVHVPARTELEVAAYKNLLAIQARRRAPLFVRVRHTRTGLESLQAADPSAARALLQELAREAPEAVSTAAQKAFEYLCNNFQVRDGSSGRNQKVNSGFVVPPNWALINNILDIIWPIEKGQMHSSKMKHARGIVDQVIIYACGEEDNDQQGRSLQDDFSGFGNEKRSERKHFFDSGWFSAILTYRHQINTLNKALLALDGRVLELQAVQCPRSDYLIARVQRLYTRALYPLLDWRRELERRLHQADYRTGDETVRRPTVGILGTPDVPRFRSDTPISLLVLRLVRAWSDYDGKKQPPNKGKGLNKERVSRNTARPGKSRAE